MNLRSSTSAARSGITGVCRAAISMVLLSKALSAQDVRCGGAAQDDSIATDRPTVTNSSAVVPCHSLQIESGLQASSEQDQQGYDLPEVALRLGLTKSTELRATIPNYFENFGAGDTFVTGAGDFAIGAKQSLAATKRGFNLAAIATVSFPTGASAVSSHGYDPALFAVASQKILSSVTAAGQLAVAWPTQGTSRNVTGQSSSYIDWQFCKPADLFLEYSGLFPSRGTPQHTIDFGALYRPSRKQQLDLRVAYGLSQAAADYSVGVGYSIRFRL